MNENIWSIFLLNKTKTFFSVKPFNCAGSHFVILKVSCNVVSLFRLMELGNLKITYDKQDEQVQHRTLVEISITVNQFQARHIVLRTSWLSQFYSCKASVKSF
jgi:hypothetical protein